MPWSVVVFSRRDTNADGPRTGARSDWFTGTPPAAAEQAPLHASSAMQEIRAVGEIIRVHQGVFVEGDIVPEN
ncbi:hypothetical protein FrEUN1fDRAFT_5201 [Parafrankia sp. EUN1f]|nr:hypothetical protein FrEUN1fDRAFT_5201 [Parafrankia sp. EUN1f]